MYKPYAGLMERGSGYTFHVYVPSRDRLACGTGEWVRAVIRDDWAYRMDQQKVCAACMTVLAAPQPPKLRRTLRAVQPVG